MRQGGILLPIFSLPNRYGIGCLSKEAFDFADFLRAAGVSCWQMLPFGPTSFGDSPYQSYSTFAGNPYFIDLEELIRLELLTRAECEEADLSADPEKVDYKRLEEGRIPLLKRAYERAMKDRALMKAVDAFSADQAHWLPDYALFMALKDENDGKSFQDWDDEGVRLRRPAALETARKRLAKKIGYYTWTQYEFDREWQALRRHCKEIGVKLIGDLPIYVSADSADAWANPQLFQFDENNRPTRVAGCPPDMFSADGQLWGNPLYAWDKHEETGFAWWMSRLRRVAEMVDVVRIDHFRGFSSYYSIPAGRKNARVGHWVKGPGYKIFKTMKETLPQLDVIAEDLGFITKSVKELVRRTGFPNMKVIQFAFGGDSAYGDSMYLPHNYGTNCVAYTGTHDNDTTLGWLASVDNETMEHVRTYLDMPKADLKALTAGLRDAVLGSVADLAVIPMQDWLLLDGRARINTPSTLGGNWQWRMKPDACSEELVKNIHARMAVYGRIPQAWREKQRER